MAARPGELGDAEDGDCVNIGRKARYAESTNKVLDTSEEQPLSGQNLRRAVQPMLRQEGDPCLGLGFPVPAEDVLAGYFRD